MNKVITCKALCLGYKKKKVIQNLSVGIPEGVMYGIVGRNGIGKSTLISGLVGLLEVQDGEIIHPYGQHNMGYVPEHMEVYDYLTGREFLQVLADLRKLPASRVESLIQEFSLQLELPDLTQLISKYSKGNVEKILFLSAFLHRPKVLILDEPFTGFDPPSVLQARKILQEYVKQGNTVILSTHILEMAAQTCNKVLALTKEFEYFEVDLINTSDLTARTELLENLFL